MTKYLFYNFITNGKYPINNPVYLDEYGQQIYIDINISAAFPGKAFSIEFLVDIIHVTFEEDLTIEEAMALETVIDAHKNYTPTQIETINNNWQTLYIDYKKARSAVKDLVWSIGFDNLSTVEKKIASKWFVIPQSMRNAVHSLEEQVLNGKSFHNNSVAARRKRATAGVSAMYNYLSIPEAFSVVDDVVNTYGLMDKYIIYGREGKVEDGLDGLFDYLYSRSGSMYETIGLLNKNIAPIGCTIQQLADAAMNIFKSGNYS